MAEPSTDGGDGLLPQPTDEIIKGDSTSEDDARLLLMAEAGAGLTMILGTAAVCTFFLIRRFQPALASRVSLRLAIVGVTSDILYSLAYLISCLPTGPTPLCTWSMFFTVFFLLSSLFLTAAIGLNLLMVFVFKVQKDRHIERTCYVVCAGVAVLVPAVAVGLDVFGWDGTECWYTYDDSAGGGESYSRVFAWQWATYYFWILGVVVFCTTCLVLFAITARNPLKAAAMDPAKDVAAQKHFSKTEKLVRKAVGRIKWYCLVPLVAHFFTFAADMYFRAVGVNLMWMMMAANLMSTGMGAMSSTVFFTLDPSVQHAFKRFRLYFFTTYYFRFHVLSDAPSAGGTLSRSGTVSRMPGTPSTGGGGGEHTLARPVTLGPQQQHAPAHAVPRKGSDEESGYGMTTGLLHPTSTTTQNTTPHLILRHPLPRTLPVLLARLLIRPSDRAKYVKSRMEARRRASSNMLARGGPGYSVSKTRVAVDEKGPGISSSVGVGSSYMAVGEEGVLGHL
ncbi:uncharacterized protein EV422DRAFT_340538 [Fimicolochytrium jonesii]|uniref:uncharacterized protein n=1 Tax=Fimicolochytrium jonesii TaxID=1396493 RepID=UPI0022FE64E1|nr:uncharacterized protein EV422DRAFT_340538 [Fimicolochytrium jonesii]KAI8815899.1 hypothetical protein EV422DRAFT_340538 [Fimicolochytrium jonesii]